MTVAHIKKVIKLNMTILFLRPHSKITKFVPFNCLKNTKFLSRAENLSADGLKALLSIHVRKYEEYYRNRHNLHKSLRLKNPDQSGYEFCYDQFME